MGYKIRYGGKKQRRRTSYGWKMGVFVTCLIMITIQILWPESIEMAYQLWIPQVLETLAGMLQEGAGLGDAVEAFCQGFTYGR